MYVSGGCLCSCNYTGVTLTKDQLDVRIKELHDLLFIDKTEITCMLIAINILVIIVISIIIRSRRLQLKKKKKYANRKLNFLNQ